MNVTATAPSHNIQPQKCKQRKLGKWKWDRCQISRSREISRKKNTIFAAPTFPNHDSPGIKKKQLKSDNCDVTIGQ